MSWGTSWGTSWGSAWGDGGAVEELPFGWGSGYYAKWREDADKRAARADRTWKKRRASLDKLDRLLSGIIEELPDDVPEAVLIKRAIAAVEKAAAAKGLAKSIKNEEAA